MKNDALMYKGWIFAFVLTLLHSTTAEAQTNETPDLICPVSRSIELNCGSSTNSNFVELVAQVRDLDGDPVTVQWSVNDVIMQTDLLASALTFTTIVFTNSYEMGTNSVSIVVSDAGGRSRSCSTTVAVNEHLSPEVVCYVGRKILFPPDHRMVNVLFFPFILDCDDATEADVVVYSNDDDEGSGHGENTSPDARDDGTVLKLRAETVETEPRIYLIVLTATDSAGNVVSDCCSVVVPVGRSRDSFATALLRARDAEEHCRMTGTPPEDYFIVGDGPIKRPGDRK